MMKTEYEIASKKGFSKQDLEDVKNVDKFKSGDDSAYGIIYNKYYRVVLFELTKLYNGNSQKAEDLASDVMIKIMNTIGKYSVENGSGLLGGWIKKIARNTFIDKTRTSKYKFSKNIVRIDKKVDLGESEVNLIQIREPELNAEENLISKELKSEINKKIKQAIKKLNAEEQQILHLRFDCELSFEEISKEVNKTKNYCLVKFHRIKSKLKKNL
jgi:RNA polymerase sigma factor (sigma-70 family)